jgi:pimeloyl-ACP methyl ester carboxylesterase
MKATNYTIRLPHLVLILFSLFLAPGCGGGGGDNKPEETLTRVRVSIAWAERTRNVSAPGSALSAVLTISGAKADGSEFTYLANRDQSNLAAHTQIYVPVEQVKVGNYPFALQFYAATDGQGDVVGTASGSVTIRYASGGSELPSVATTGKITSVEVVAGQTLTVGEKKEITFRALGQSGEIIAIVPGAERWTVESGNEKLSVSPTGEATAILPGQASVRVKVDGIQSVPQVVSVTAPMVSNTYVIRPTTETVIDLPSGIRAVIPADTFPTEIEIIATVQEQPTSQPASGIITSVGHILRLELPEGALAQMQKEIMVSLTVPPTTPRWAGSVPFVRFDAQNGPFFVALEGTVATETGTASWKLSATDLQRGAIYNNARTGNALEIGLANLVEVPISRSRAENAYGGKFWDGSKFIPFEDALQRGLFDPNKRTVFFGHGVASNPDQAFGKRANDLIRGGKYGQGIAYHYDWTRPINESATNIADFLKSTGLKSFDVQAHSLGTVTSLAAVNQLPLDTRVNQMVLYAGPLRGVGGEVPPGMHLLTWAFNFVSPRYGQAILETMRRLSIIGESPIVSDLAFNNDRLRAIREEFSQKRRSTTTVTTIVAEGDWVILPGDSADGSKAPELGVAPENALRVDADHGTVTETDQVVQLVSAITSNVFNSMKGFEWGWKGKWQINGASVDTSLSVYPSKGKTIWAVTTLNIVYSFYVKKDAQGYYDVEYDKNGNYLLHCWNGDEKNPREFDLTGDLRTISGIGRTIDFNRNEVSGPVLLTRR